MTSGPNLSRLHPRLRYIARNIPRAAAAIGFNARVTSGFRSYAKQLALYNAWQRGENPYPASPPGQSSHERGLAIDVVSDSQRDLVRLLTSAGLSWYGPGDPVHFSIGGRKSQATAISSYREEVGSRIPEVLGRLPIVGLGFEIARDPVSALKTKAKLLLTAITGGWL